MLYDLNVPWTPDGNPGLQRTIAFLDELGYNVLALNHNINGVAPTKNINPIPSPLPFTIPPKTTILRRCTFTISDPSQNHRLSSLAPAYDILALRPTTEKAFLSACLAQSEHSIISLDLTQRFPFFFRPKPLMTAVNRGIRFEICYSQAIGNADANARRNAISNTLAIIRATRGRGIIVSSEAKSVLGCRAPADVVNLLQVWGLGQEKGMEAIGQGPRLVVVNEGMKRRAFKGVIDVVDGGESTAAKDPAAAEAKEKSKGKGGAKNQQNAKGKGNTAGGKRKGAPGTPNMEGTTGENPPISKRQAKKMRLEAARAMEGVETGPNQAAADPTTK